MGFWFEFWIPLKSDLKCATTYGKVATFKNIEVAYLVSNFVLLIERQVFFLSPKKLISHIENVLCPLKIIILKKIASVICSQHLFSEI